MNAGAVVQEPIRRKVVWGARLRLIAVVALVGVSASCGKASRQGQSASYLIINALEGASGADPQKFGGTLYSDVITLVKTSDGQVPSIFADLGRVRMMMALKDIGTPSAPTTPSSNN